MYIFVLAQVTAKVTKIYKQRTYIHVLYICIQVDDSIETDASYWFLDSDKHKCFCIFVATVIFLKKFSL